MSMKNNLFVFIVESIERVFVVTRLKHVVLLNIVVGAYMLHEKENRNASDFSIGKKARILNESSFNIYALIAGSI